MTTSIGHNGGPPMIRGNDGWIAISRAIRSHWLVGFGQPVKPMDANRGSHSRSEAFIDLLMECRYSAGVIMNGGRKMELKAGQMVGAVSWLANRWNWSPQTVRTWLDKLQDDGMIERSSPGVEAENNKQLGKQATVITVCNYSEYQLINENEQQAIQQANNLQATSTQHASNNIYKDKQGNKGTKEQEEITLPPVDAREKRAAVNRSVAKAAFVEWQAFARQFDLTVPRDSTYDVFGKKLATRLFEHATDPKGFDEMMGIFRDALAQIERSAFLRGMTGNFKADLKFICQRESFAKLISGGFGNGAHAKPGQSVKGTDDQLRQFDAIMTGGR